MREADGPYDTLPRMHLATIHGDRADCESGDFHARCDVPWRCTCTDCVDERNARQGAMRTRTWQRARRVRRLNLDHRHRQAHTKGRRR